MGKRVQGDIVGEFRSSGLTQSEFCKRRGIATQTLQYHLKRAVVKADRQFVRVGTASMIEVEASNGVKVRLPADVEVSVLRKVLEAAGAHT